MSGLLIFVQCLITQQQRSVQPFSTGSLKCHSKSVRSHIFYILAKVFVWHTSVRALAPTMGTQRDVVCCVKNVAKKWQIDWQGEKGECEENQRGFEREEEKKEEGWTGQARLRRRRRVDCGAEDELFNPPSGRGGRGWRGPSVWLLECFRYQNTKGGVNVWTGLIKHLQQRRDQHCAVFYI